MMAVAVGVAVVALGAGVVGCLLQPHQHVHLKKAESMSSFLANRPPARLSWPPASSRLLRQTHLGTARLWARLPGFKSRLDHLLAA